MAVRFAAGFMPAKMAQRDPENKKPDAAAVRPVFRAQVYLSQSPAGFRAGAQAQPDLGRGSILSGGSGADLPVFDRADGDDHPKRLCVAMDTALTTAPRDRSANEIPMVLHTR